MEKLMYAALQFSVLRIKDMEQIIGENEFYMGHGWDLLKAFYEFFSRTHFVHIIH